MSTPIGARVSSGRSAIDPLGLTDDLKLEIQPHTRLLLDRASDCSDQSDHVGRRRMPTVNDKIAVLQRNFRISDTQALQTKRFKQTAGGIIGGVLNTQPALGMARGWVSLL